MPKESWSDFATRHRGLPTWRAVVQERYEGSAERMMIALLEREIDPDEEAYLTDRLMVGGSTGIALSLIYRMVRDLRRDVRKIAEGQGIEL